MKLFTFIVESNGSTTLEQVTAPNVAEAARRWTVIPEGARIPLDRLELDAPTAIDGLRNVWCLSGVDHDDAHCLVHIVQTATLELVRRGSHG